MDAVVVESASPPPESGRSSPSPTASPEFEFWMVGKNPGSFPSPALLTADELFSDGIVLPLHTLQPPCSNGEEEEEAEEHAEDEEAEEDAGDAKEPTETEGEFSTQPLAESCTVPAPDLPAVTFKWKDIFKTTGESKERSSKKSERRVSSVSGNSELININIWPFSRSRSAGHSTAGPGAGISKAKAGNPSATNVSVAVAVSAPASSAAPVSRKVSSAPCSRSNSRGETSGPAAPAVAIAAAAEKAAAQAGALPATSMLRRWVPGGQGRTGAGASGIRLGRASTVWQLRRNKLQQQQAAVAEQKQKESTASDKSKAVPDVVDVTTSQADTGEDDDKLATAASVAPESVSAPPTAAPCRNNAACSEAGVEECIPPHGLFGLRRNFFSKKVY